MRMKHFILSLTILAVACADEGADGAPELVVLTPEVAGYDDPSLSPDGSQIAFTRRDSPNNKAVWVADANGANARRVSEFARKVSEPRWSPDGATVL